MVGRHGVNVYPVMIGVLLNWVHRVWLKELLWIQLFLRETMHRKYPYREYYCRKMVSQIDGHYLIQLLILILNITEERLFPPRITAMGKACSTEEMRAVSRLKSEKWLELMESTKMRPGYAETRKNYIYINCNEVFSHLRINIYPDGGIARFKVYGEVEPYINDFGYDDNIDLIALVNGGSCVGYSNAHYGHPRNLIKPGRGLFMGDGWETMRRMDRPEILEVDENGMLIVHGSEWAAIKMCCLGKINSILVDTNHFKGNYPDSIKIEGAILHEDETLRSADWTTIMDAQKLSANREHFYESEILNEGPFNYVRLTMAPDGGISRIRLIGNQVPEMNSYKRF